MQVSMKSKSINKLVVGILGGMGPYATLAFFENILRNTPVKRESENIHLVIDNNPHMPSRTMAYLGIGPSPVKDMIESCRKLEKYPVDLIVVPCNSASYFINEVQSQCKVKILNIVEVTSSRLEGKYKHGSRVAIWGGRITHQEKLYKKPLENRNFIYIEHTEEEELALISMIEEIKINGNIDSTNYGNFLTSYYATYRPDVIILGCTEFSYLLKIPNPTQAKLVDSSTELALHVIELTQ